MTDRDAEILAALKGADAYFQKESGAYVPTEKTSLENEDAERWRDIVRAIRLIERTPLADGAPANPATDRHP